MREQLGREGDSEGVREQLGREGDSEGVRSKKGGSVTVRV